MSVEAAQQATGGVAGATNQAAPAPGSYFGMPKFSTQRRFVPDNGNAAIGATPVTGGLVTLPTTKLDQLDIVTGMKIYGTYAGTWTNTGAGLQVSPFFPSNLISQITFKLQAAYNTFNLTGPLAAIIQAYRPMWGQKNVGPAYPNAFSKLNLAAGKPTFGAAFSANFAIDVPFSIRFDEYYELDAEGNPVAKLYDEIVTPMMMAAQARVVTPQVSLSPAIGVTDLLGSPVSRPNSDATSTFTAASWSSTFLRDAFWSANNAAANPPQHPWIYTRDYYTQPTSGQGKVGVLIQNTGVSVGQVLSLFGFVWDPAANSGLGAMVPFSSIASYELVVGGSLQSQLITPQAMQDDIQSQYGLYDSADTASWPSGIFIFDFAREKDGGSLTNRNAINTYMVNGVQLNITFKAGLIPGALSTVYMGVEALKLATS